MANDGAENPLWFGEVKCMWNLINPLEEYMLVWKVKYQGTSCLYEHFQSAWDDWKSFKGEWRLIYPKLVLKGFWHRGMKDFSGW